MKRELKVTLSSAEVHEMLIKVVAKRQKLPDGNYSCACAMTNGELSLVFSLPEEKAEP